MDEDRFERIYRAIARRQPMLPPPHFDAGVGADLRAAFLGRPIRTLQDDIDFWDQAGLCLYPVSFGLIQFGGKLAAAGSTVARAHYSIHRADEVEMAWAPTGRGAISSDADFERYPWPDADQVDLAVLDEVAPLLPHGMKVLANIGKIFTGTWQLMGFMFFAESLHDRPELVERVFERVASIQMRITERVLEHPSVGAVLHADDMAYCSGPMVDPAVLRRHVFPAYRTVAARCRQRRILYLFHSDGRIQDLIPDIVDAGFVGLHPLEPKPVDAADVKRRWGDRLCLLGHIDVDLLARGTPRQVRDQTQRCMDLLARGGGYCPGSANSVPDYVPLANLVAMIEAIRQWRG